MAMYDRKQPYVIQEKPGKKAYCACGLTGNPPYCDGSHKGTGKQSRFAGAENPGIYRNVMVPIPNFNRLK